MNRPPKNISDETLDSGADAALIARARLQAEAAIAPVEPAHDASDKTRAVLVRRPPSSSSGAEALPSADAFVGYEIIRKIQGGGQGVVYLAAQKSTGKKVALKVIREGPFADPRNRMRLERGVRILSELNHPHIVRIIDSGEAAGAMYYVMDYISGSSLDEWLEARRLSALDEARKPGRRYWTSRRRSAASSRVQRADIDEVVRLFIKVCDAVNAAHVKGVIHRDLKPGNVRVDENGEPHILDFDLAKIVVGEFDPEGRYAEMTQTGEFLGSLRWASPEQVERVPSKIDMRTDVYSIGVMLYEVLTGQAPYPVLGTRRDLEDQILNTEPPRPSILRRQIEDDLDTIVLKCLAKSRERRYQSAGAVADDLRSFLAGAPISARRDSTWYLLKKLTRRHALATTALVAVIVTLISSTVISIYFYEMAALHAVDKQVAAEQALERARFAETSAMVAQHANAKLSLGWFLLEMQRGNLHRAQQIRDSMPRHVPERAAMNFVLDRSILPERLVAELPADAAALAHYAVGERALFDGRDHDAVEAFEACLALPHKDTDKWYKAAARTRLDEIGAKGARGQGAE